MLPAHITKIKCLQSSFNISNKLLISNKYNVSRNIRSISTTTSNHLFHEFDRKGGYDTKSKEKVRLCN